MTEWRDVPDFPDYRVSDDERIMSLKNPSRPRILKPSMDKKGYLFVAMRRDGKSFTRKIHTLVALAFLGPRPEGLQVRHLNGDSLDNRPANLKYGTRSENAQDSIAHGTHNEARKTHCKNDHEFTPENTYLNKNGHRYCRTCYMARARERYARRSAE